MVINNLGKISNHWVDKLENLDLVVKRMYSNQSPEQIQISKVDMASLVLVHHLDDCLHAQTNFFHTKRIFLCCSFFLLSLKNNIDCSIVLAQADR